MEETQRSLTGIRGPEFGVSRVFTLTPNSMKFIDVLGLGPFSSVALGGFCEGYSLGSLFNTFEDLDRLREETKHLEDLITKLENSCDLMSRPDWYQDYINKLRADHTKLVNLYLRSNGNMLPGAIGQQIGCGAGAAILLLLPIP